MSAQSLGEKLKSAREERGLSVEQVSRVLSLRPSLVMEMESGDYREIGALLYARNYLRKYAKFLDMENAQFEADLEEISVKSDPKSQGFYDTSKVKLEVEEKKRSNNFKYYLIFVVILLAVFAYLYQTGVIPSPFKERLSNDDTGSVSLPNERLPSLELEYSVNGNNLTNAEEVSFEELLIDSVKSQQISMVDEYHGDNSIVQMQSEFYKEDEYDSHVVVLNRENALINDNLTNNQDSKKKRGSGTFHSLGKALRNYAPLLSEDALPLIDLGTQDPSGRFTAAKDHIYYLYATPNTYRFGVETPHFLVTKLNELHSQNVSIYDRESQFYPLISTFVADFKLRNRKADLVSLESEREELERTLSQLKQVDEINENEISEITEQVEKLVSIEDGLGLEVARLQEMLNAKALVKIKVKDITTFDIKDVKGRVLANKVMKSGDEYQLEGHGIYDVYLGNPAVVDKITVNGKTIPEYYYKPLTEEAVSIRFSLNSDQYH